MISGGKGSQESPEKEKNIWNWYRIQDANQSSKNSDIYVPDNTYCIDVAKCFVVLVNMKSRKVANKLWIIFTSEAPDLDHNPWEHLETGL